MSDNPFQAPLNQPGQNYPQQNGPQSFGRGYVKQIPVIASLMIAQGVLLLVFTALMIGYAFFFANISSMVGDAPQQTPEMQEMFQMQEKIVPIIFGVMGGCSGALSILHFIAAYFGFTYRYRAFGIATMILGLSAMLTFYCAPTAIGLAVYGMIIYFNPAVAEAFRLRKTGMKKQDILAKFPH